MFTRLFNTSLRALGLNTTNLFGEIQDLPNTAQQLPPSSVVELMVHAQERDSVGRILDLDKEPLAEKVKNSVPKSFRRISYAEL